MPYYYVPSDSEDSDAGYNHRIQKRRQQKRGKKVNQNSSALTSGRTIQKKPKSLPIPSAKKQKLEAEAQEYFDIFDRVAELDLDSVVGNVEFLTTYIELLQELETKLESLIARAKGNQHERFRRRVAYYVAAVIDLQSSIAELLEEGLADGIASSSDSDSCECEECECEECEGPVCECSASESDSDSEDSGVEVEVDVNDSDLDSDIVNAVLNQAENESSSDSDSSSSSDSEIVLEEDEVLCSGCSDCEIDDEEITSESDSELSSSSSSSDSSSSSSSSSEESDFDSDIPIYEVGSEDDEELVIVEPSDSEFDSDDY